MSDGSPPQPDRSSVLRFASEIVAWIATPWMLAAHSPVLAGVALMLLIGLPTIFATPGDKATVVVAVPGHVTVGLVVLQLLAAMVASWVVWPVPVALLVWALVLATVYAELPRWRRLTGSDLVITGPAHVVNRELAFSFGLLAQAALAWWGAEAGRLFHLPLGIGLPVVAAGLLWVFTWPKPRVPLPMAGVLAVKAAVFGSATLALNDLGHRTLAITFGVIVAANTVIAAIGHGVKPIRRLSLTGR